MLTNTHLDSFWVSKWLKKTLSPYWELIWPNTYSTIHHHTTNILNKQAQKWWCSKVDFIFFSNSSFSVVFRALQTSLWCTFLFDPYPRQCNHQGHQSTKSQPIHQKRLLKENDISCTSFLQLNKETSGWIFYEVQKIMDICEWVCVFLFKFPPGWLSQFEFRTHGFAGFVGRLLLIQPFFLKAHLYNPLPLKKRSPTKITNQPNSLPCQSRIGEGWLPICLMFFVVRALWQQDSPSCTTITTSNLYTSPFYNDHTVVEPLVAQVFK